MLNLAKVANNTIQYIYLGHTRLEVCMFGLWFATNSCSGSHGSTSRDAILVDPQGQAGEKIEIFFNYFKSWNFFFFFNKLCEILGSYI